MVINIVSFSSKDHNTSINVNRKYFSINTYKNNGGKFIPGPPAASVTISEKLLTTIGRVAKSLMTSSMGTTKNILFSKIDYTSKSKEPLLTITLSKELTKRSLYGITFSYAATGESFSYEFSVNPTIEITSDDLSVEAWSTDFLVDFIQVLSAANLTVFKNMSIDPNSAITVNKDGDIVKKPKTDAIEPARQNMEEDIEF